MTGSVAAPRQSTAPRERLPHVPGRLPAAAALPLLALLTLCCAVAALGTGAFPITPGEVGAILAHQVGLAGANGFRSDQAAVLMSIRLPRVALGLLTGAALALGGAVLQGLFRNPLADAALVGISPGAALAAAAVIVLGPVLPAVFTELGAFKLPLAAFLGALGTAIAVFRLSQVDGRSSLAVMLLAGIAIGALAWAGIGFFSYVSTEEQLRNLTFWQLGSLGGGGWAIVGPVAVLAGGASVLLLRLASALDAFALGEAEARHLGVDVQRLKRTGVALTALAVGAVTAVTGIIGFIGLVAPHLVRLACGPSHRVVLPGAALAGAALVVAADMPARTLVAPAELPIGVLTAFVGAPFFLFLLLRARRAWTF
jgi:iron complex transport system permease protein